MKQFDDIFSRKVKDAFDSFDANHLAREGWNSYLHKYGKQRRLAVFIPMWAKVASIAVLVTAGVLLITQTDQKKADDPVNLTAQEIRSELRDSTINAQDTAGGSQIMAVAVPVAEAAGSLSADIAKIADSHFADSEKAVEMPAAINLPDNPVEIRLTSDAGTELKPKIKEALHPYGDVPREKMTTTIMTGLSGMMASIDNTASTSQGVSIGFYIEQQLTPRISVRPGLAMAKHNYSMESTSGGSAAFDYAAPELNGLSGSTTSYEVDIEVLSMEVPVNFVFSLRKRSGTNLFVTAGASTLIYLGQHLSGNFNNTYTRATVDSYGTVSYESMTTSVKIERDQELLNRVDLLGLANFSAGYSLPFGKTTHLLFEPFVQLPVKDLTSLNLRIRYGGLSMKIQF